MNGRGTQKVIGNLQKKKWGEEELLWEEEVQEANACGIRTYRRGTWATLPFGLSPTQMRQPNN